MSSENTPEIVVLAGRETSLHLRALQLADRIQHHPATHRGTGLMVPGVEAGQTFVYGGRTWRILKAWDEDAAQVAARSAPAAAPGKRVREDERPAEDRTLAFHRGRVGRFLDLLAVAVEG